MGEKAVTARGTYRFSVKHLSRTYDQATLKDKAGKKCSLVQLWPTELSLLSPEAGSLPAGRKGSGLRCACASAPANCRASGSGGSRLTLQIIKGRCSATRILEQDPQDVLHVAGWDVDCGALCLWSFPCDTCPRTARRSVPSPTANTGASG